MIMRVDKVATPTLIQIQPTSQWSLFRHPRSVNINGRPEKWLVSRSQTSVDDVDLLQLFHILALVSRPAVMVVVYHDCVRGITYYNVW